MENKRNQILSKVAESEGAMAKLAEERRVAELWRMEKDKMKKADKERAIQRLQRIEAANRARLAERVRLDDDKVAELQQRRYRLEQEKIKIKNEQEQMKQVTIFDRSAVRISTQSPTLQTPDSGLLPPRGIHPAESPWCERASFFGTLGRQHALVETLNPRPYTLHPAPQTQALVDAVDAMRKTNKWVPPPGVDLDIDIEEIKRNAEAGVRRSEGAKSEKSGLGSKTDSASRVYGQGSRGSVGNSNRGGGSLTARGGAPPRPPKGKGPPQVKFRPPSADPMWNVCFVASIFGA